MSGAYACRIEACGATTAASVATSPRSYGCSGSLARPAAAGTLRTAARGVCGLLRLGHTRLRAGCAGPAAAALQCRFGMYAALKQYHCAAHVCSLRAPAEADAPAGAADAPPQTGQADAISAGSSTSAAAAGTILSAVQPRSGGVLKTSSVDYTTLLACCQEVEVPARIDQVGLVPPSSSRVLPQLSLCQSSWSSCISHQYASVPERHRSLSLRLI